MIMIQDQKSNVESTRDSLDESAGGPPPAYDALSIHQSTNQTEIQHASFSASPGPVAAEPSSDPSGSDSARFKPPVLNIDKSLPLHPNASPALVQRPNTRKNTSWFSLLPFASSFSAKRARQSILSVISDLAVPHSRVEQKNVHEVLASIAETCAEHKLSLSTILQETSIAGHTPMYWAVFNYRQELLVALLVHSRPLSIQTVSDIRRACLVSSNQALFHALRTCRPPFHGTDGIQLPSLRTASDNLFLGDRPLDEIHIAQATEQAFVVFFDIPLWQRRMKAIGQVDIEFIVSGRMWSVTFFSTHPPLPTVASGKSKKAKDTWHVMVSLLESSLPTYFNSQLVVDAPPPLAPESIQTPKLQGAQPTTSPPSRDKQYQSRSSMHDSDSDRKAHSRLPRGHNVLAPSEQDGGPSSSLREDTATPVPVSIRLECGGRKLGCRTGSGESSKPLETPTTKPDTWSDHGVGYTNAAVAPLEEGLASQLVYDHSRYLLPDGTLRGRLEATFMKPESSKGCIIC